MNDLPSSNGHHPERGPVSGKVNHYVDAAIGEKPPEIVEYEKNADPYMNMLPGISNINAARTVSRGIEVGRRGNWGVMLVSSFLLVVFLLPMLLAILSHLGR